MKNLTADDFDTTVLQSEKPVLVDFWAPWCGPCRLMGPVVEELAAEMPEAAFAKVNVDDEPSLAGRFNILSIPTFVILKGGEAVDQFSGSMDKAALRERVGKFL